MRRYEIPRPALHVSLQFFFIAFREARDAVEGANFFLAEQLFNKASQQDEEAAHKLQQVATARLTSAAAAQATNGDPQSIQFNFIKAQAYYRKALDLLPPQARNSEVLISIG